jgi:hypothetical protein
MSLLLDDFNRRKEALERLLRDAAKAQGRAEEIRARAERKFGVTTVKELKAVYNKRLKKEPELLAEYNRLVGEIDEEFGDRLKEYTNADPAG